MQNGGTISSLKFSYWSSPQTSTKSGLKSSRILRSARKSLPKRSPQRCAAPIPLSLPSSASSSDGQLAGSLRAGSTFGASSTRLNTSVSRSFGRHKVGQWVQPGPRISAISVPPPNQPDTIKGGPPYRYRHETPNEPRRNGRQKVQI